MSRTNPIANEMSRLVPTFLRHMFPYVFKDMSLPPSQVMALVSIEEQGECSLKQLKEQMHVTAPTITGIVGRLERDGYVKRKKDTADRRVVKVCLTKKGAGVVLQFRNNIRSRWAYILDKMPPEVGQSVLRSIRRITQGFKDGFI